jgi:hypothetical protein
MAQFAGFRTCTRDAWNFRAKAVSLTIAVNSLVMAYLPELADIPGPITVALSA